VFCHLILLGEKTTERNVFDALDFFLLDEYMSDNCLLATCDGFAKDILNVTPLVDPSGSVAIQKILSPHAERVGSVLPSTLREFAIGYYSESKSGYLPILKTQPQQEQINGETAGAGMRSSDSSSSSGDSSGSGGEKKENADSSSSSGGEKNSNSSDSGGSSSSTQQGKQGEKSNDKPVFSANETALFVNGKRVGKLTKEETFAFNAVESELKLAAYTVQTNTDVCTLTVKRNVAKRDFVIGETGQPTLKIKLTMTAGLLDYSSALPLQTADVGDVPNGTFEAAEKLLSAQLTSLFEKCRACKCDLFKIVESLQKKEHALTPARKAPALDKTHFDVQGNL
jgi:hypothetical protein